MWVVVAEILVVVVMVLMEAEGVGETIYTTMSDSLKGEEMN